MVRLSISFSYFCFYRKLLHLILQFFKLEMYFWGVSILHGCTSALPKKEGGMQVLAGLNRGILIENPRQAMLAGKICHKVI
jgi:hypothetical protein